MHGTDWRTSTRCQPNNQCVEVRPTSDSVLVQDTTDRGTALSFSKADWMVFLQKYSEAI